MIHVADAYCARCSRTFYTLLLQSCIMAAYTFLDFGDEMPHSVAKLASALNEKKESRTGATRRGVRMVKKKSKIDDQITKARNAEASWLKMFMEEGQASLNNRAHDMIQEVQNAEAIWLKKFLEIVRQERKE